ncbi:uncharacterized protein [Rutidosis leptorrhynchoides]|uniref:uncharacterized protein n=1 Tax=Rutidosis leptorrhynchoides TaxID=125765 RepID=UPI003A99716C
MKIISYNIRGFGVGVESKFGETKKFIIREKPAFLALQETKLNTVNGHWIYSLWGDVNFDFIQTEKVGKSGGQLLIWDTNYFAALDVIRFDRVLGVRGIWKSSGIPLNVLNIYGPHDDSKKQILWDSLSKLVSNDNEAWVLCGDFNEVRDRVERFNCEFVEGRAKKFNEFISLCNLTDIPIGGRVFTRVSDDGFKFSKLDRFLVSESFLELWDNLSAITLDRTKSDHCPIMLKNEEINFGPKPFEVFDVWFDDVGVEKIISDAWNETVKPSNRSDCTFMYKLKNVKNALRSWSKDKFGQIDREIETHKSEALKIELKAEKQQVDESELERWKLERKKWIEKDRIKA